MKLFEVIDSIAAGNGLKNIDYKSASDSGILRYSNSEYRYTFVYNPRSLNVVIWRMARSFIDIKLLGKVSVNFCDPDSIDLIKNFIR